MEIFTLLLVPLLSPFVEMYVIPLHLVQKCTLVQALRLCTGRAAHRVNRGKLYSFLTTTVEGGEGSASRPGRSLPRAKRGIHFTGG